MKMETPLHQLNVQTRRAKELRWMDERADRRAGGRTDVRIVWIHSRGFQQRDLQVAFTLSAGQISMKSVPP